MSRSPAHERKHTSTTPLTSTRRRQPWIRWRGLLSGSAKPSRRSHRSTPPSHTKRRSERSRSLKPTVNGSCRAGATRSSTNPTGRHRGMRGRRHCHLYDVTVSRSAIPRYWTTTRKRTTVSMAESRATVADRHPHPQSTSATTTGARAIHDVSGPGEPSSSQTDRSGNRSCAHGIGHPVTSYEHHFRSITAQTMPAGTSVTVAARPLPAGRVAVPTRTLTRTASRSET